MPRPSFFPQIAAGGKLQMDNALGAAGTSAGALGFDQLAKGIVLYVRSGSGNAVRASKLAPHLTHILMAHDVAALHRRLISVEEMEIRAADRTGG